MNRRHTATAACIALASLSIAGSASAQLPPAVELPPDLPTVMPAMPAGGYPPTVAPTAAAPYFVPPAWSQTLAPNVRFVILSNFNSDAVLDRETGLVWARRFVKQTTGILAVGTCKALTVGARMGWRLPTVAELQSLMDLSLPQQSEPRLPVGHPFLLSAVSNIYWASETEIRSGVEDLLLRSHVNFATGGTGAGNATLTSLTFGVLCVRGSTDKDT